MSAAYHSTGIPDIRVFAAAPGMAGPVVAALSRLIRIPGAPRATSFGAGFVDEVPGVAWPDGSGRVRDTGTARRGRGG